VNQQPRQTVSIIIPVYNEGATAHTLIAAVLAKDIAADKQIIIVESNSTDGTRELVAAFDGRPGVSVLWQDRPRGKGHAVRAGLASATGDIVLIQDADLEYSVDDYDAVLRPLLNGEADFVLGSRHLDHHRFRSFDGQRVLTKVINRGHWFFAGLVNALCGTQLNDPFTMFKVFRRRCLDGVHLRGNSFDLDFEIVIKLIRRGYVPVEVPVTYRSRSFQEGKKVRIYRDPWIWLWAAFRSRYGPL
jgi:glycosyltransferase involved in cell wall biosynthesis